MVLRALVTASVVLALCGLGHAQRTIDFQGGVVVTQPPRDDLDPLPGLALGLRYFRGPLWLSGNLAAEPSLDFTNPERGELMLAITAGPGAGAFVDLGARATLLGGVRLDGVTAGDWPGATSRAYGVRLGATASAVITLGHPWGHAMGLELRGAWFRYEMSRGDSLSSWQLGLFVSGVLFPEPRDGGPRLVRRARGRPAARGAL